MLARCSSHRLTKKAKKITMVTKLLSKIWLQDHSWSARPKLWRFKESRNTNRRANLELTAGIKTETIINEAKRRIGNLFWRKTKSQQQRDWIIHSKTSKLIISIRSTKWTGSKPRIIIQAIQVTSTSISRLMTLIWNRLFQMKIFRKRMTSLA